MPKLLDELLTSDSISEAIIVSTCNRVELYADVSRFHPALADVSALLARISGIDVGVLAEHLYVHFAEAAVEHLFSVAAGLDSMVVGESQILGQLRAAYAVGTETGSVGRVLHELVQSALRTGKTVHTDTGIDRAGASIVSVALDHAEAVLGGLADRRVLIVGAGLDGRAGRGHRPPPWRRGHRRDQPHRRPRRAARPRPSTVARWPWTTRPQCGPRSTPPTYWSAVPARPASSSDAADFGPRTGRDLVVLDLALPRDVNPAVAGLHGVRYVDLDVLREAGAMVSDSDVAEATAIVTERLARYLDEQQQLAVAPTVTALRARASAVIESELRRLDGRLPDLDIGARAEVATAVRRAVEKVLHAPTVRVKELAATPDGDRYAAALRALFDLDPASPETVVAIRAQSRRHSGSRPAERVGPR